jgi:LCP family protein required for cell wall assembly
MLRWAEDQFDKKALGAEDLPDIEETTAAGAPVCDPICTYLVLGSDSRSGLTEEEQEAHGSTETVTGQRADTIILVRVDPAREKTVVLHFPRDLFVPILDDDPETPEEWKINSAFEAGPNGMVRTIESLTGIQIDHYVEVNLAGFEQTVEALGGVRICVDRPMRDPVSFLNLRSAGCYDMGGKTALAYVRSRHVVGECGIPDFNRISRQQQFLRAVMKKLLSPAVFTRLGTLVPAVANNLPHDAGLDLTDLLDLANELKGIDTGGVDFRAVPSAPGDTPETSGFVYMTDEAPALFHRLATGRPLGDLGRELVLTPPSPANVKVRVVNVSSQGTAAKVQEFLANSGFAIVGEQPTDRVPGGVAGPVIVYGEGKEAQAKVVQGFLPGLEIVQGSLTKVDVAVVITSDYTGPGSGASAGGGGTGGTGTPAPTPPPSTSC